MELANGRRWAKAGAEPYYMALLGYFLAFSVRYTLQPILDDKLPMLFFAINCVVIAFLYGFWPSFWILILSLPTAMFFFVKPFYSFNGIAELDIFLLIVYFTLVTITAVLFEWLHREQYKAELLARVSDTRYRLLVEADEDRRAMLKKETL